LLVTVLDKPSVCLDPDDDIVVACALSADADYLVTGNLADFPTDWTRPRIINARTFLERLDSTLTALEEEKALAHSSGPKFES
jgi:predicted nucleic acid-binding protein